MMKTNLLKACALAPGNEAHLSARINTLPSSSGELKLLAEQSVEWGRQKAGLTLFGTGSHALNELQSCCQQLQQCCTESTVELNSIELSRNRKAKEQQKEEQEKQN